MDFTKNTARSLPRATQSDIENSTREEFPILQVDDATRHFVELVRHVIEDHGHLAGEESSLSGVYNKAEQPEKHTNNKAETQTTMRQQPPIRHVEEMRQESSAEGFQSVAAGAPTGYTPTITTESLDAQTNAAAITAGSNIMGELGGVSVEIPGLNLVPGVMPPEIGLITGVQWSVLDQAMSAYTVLQNGQISNTSHPEGSEVFTIGLEGLLAGSKFLKDYILAYKYWRPEADIQLTIFGTTNTTGSILVYDEEDPEVNVVSVARGLARPHVTIPFSGGTQSYPLTLQDINETMSPRKTTGTAITSSHCFRAVMYSPLVNTYGTDLSLNFKVLMRPGPGFRVWAPTSSKPSTVMDELKLPNVPYIILDSNRMARMSPAEQALRDTQIETPGLNRFEYIGHTSIPTGPKGFGPHDNLYMNMADNMNSDGQGYITPCGWGVTESATGFWDLMMANADPTHLATSWEPGKTFGQTGPGSLGMVGDVPTIVLDNAFGYVGKTNEAFPDTTDSTIYAGGKPNGEFVVHKQWSTTITPDQLPDLRRDSYMSSTRATAEGALRQANAYSNINRCLIAPAFYPGPLIPGDTTAGFAAPDRSWANWGKAIYDYCNASGLKNGFDGKLWVNNTYLGEVRVVFAGWECDISLWCEEKYMEYASDGSIRITDIKASSKLDLPYINPTIWSSRRTNQAFDTEAIKLWYDRLKTAVNKVKPSKATGRKGRLEPRHVCVSEASIVAGGIMQGLGSALGQWSQNQFWKQEFGYNRQHEMDMLMKQTQADKELLQTEQTSDHYATVGKSRMQMEKMGLGTAREAPRPSNAPPSYAESQRGHTDALLNKQNEYVNQMVNKAPNVYKNPPPPTSRVVKRQAPPPPKTRATTMAPQPQGPSMQGPPPPQLPSGEMTSHGMENYHPASVNDGAQTTPAAVASAQAPFTEAMKRK